MSGPHESFKNLLMVAETGYDATQLSSSVDSVERRISRVRSWRTALQVVAALIVVGGVASLALNIGDGRVTKPVTGVNPAPSTKMSVDGELSDPRCSPATIVHGKPAANFREPEGWFSATPMSDCEEWDPQVLDHPDTVLINTVDNTMIAAYHRTGIDALGNYASLGEDYAVPETDPLWPPFSAVLIDAATGEILVTYRLPGYAEPDYTLLEWFGWVEERLGSSLASAEIPDGYAVASPATAETTDEDLVAPRSYAASNSADLVTVRLIAVPEHGRTDTPTIEETSIVDTDVYTTGSVITFDSSTGIYTVDIHVLDEADVKLTGSDLEALRRFVDAIVTVEPG